MLCANMYFRRTYFTWAVSQLFSVKLEVKISVIVLYWDEFYVAVYNQQKQGSLISLMMLH